ncbi:2-dehydropantoate 2-reductase [Aquisphaera giovannonii]|uniref:2-dehydropantoate 2-reductase n=2 Tax=Aquisphaera giovannonii TaxID=406548 RepID=A0A5B9WAN1_9BACT|nr:2-dehydropantoate 2-reductase [Aquisphaera giovannonii]
MDELYVVGAGGIGCAVAYALIAAGIAPAIVESDPRKIAAGAKGHLRVAGSLPRPARFVAFGAWQPSARSTILLCTKCYDNAQVLARVPAGATLVPIQNGFDPGLTTLSHEFEGVASFVSECDRDRPWTRITRPGDLHLGRRQSTGRRETRPQVFDALRRSGLFRTIEVRDIEPFKHAKLMYNAAISPIAATGGVDNGRLLSDPSARRLFFDLLGENFRILSAAGIELGRVGPLRPETVARILRRRWLATAMGRFFEPSLRGTYCSMAGDIERGRTEVENYNGHLIRLARSAGVPCPLNEAAFDLVRSMTARGQRPSTAAWRLLAAA